MERLGRRRLYRFAYPGVLILLLLLLGAMASCETQKADPVSEAPPRTVQTLTAVERPLREPESGFVTILCDQLTVDLSREIYIADVMKKFVDTYHMMTRDERSRPVEETFKNTSGGLRVPLEFRILSTRFLVIQSARFRVYSKGEARLDLTAEGHVQIIEKGAKAPRDVKRLRVSEGVWKED